MGIVIAGLVAGSIGMALFESFAAFWTAAGLGALAAWVNRLSLRVRHLEQQATVAGAKPSPEPSPAPLSRQTSSSASASASAYPSGSASTSPPATAQTDGKRSSGAPHGSAAPTPVDRGLAWIRTWFTTGNVPVKVGVVLSVFGVGFLIKEAVDRSWMVVPIELRLVFVALFGLALLVIGWRLRDTKRVYALSVQGGGVAVMYVTIYASFALYGLLPSAAAFVMLLVITVAVGALAVLQDARSLAVLGVVGGFMAPVLTSNDAGNHVGLFSYYAILNVAIVGIAWFKAWRVLNVLGFIFTFGIGSLWGYTAYRPEQFASTEPFLVLFVLLYTLIPILFANRHAPQLKGFVDGTLLFGTPIVGFALQTRLVDGMEHGLSLSAVALAAFYIGLATYVYRKRAAHLRVLVEALFSLGIVFVTVAIPLALDARWTSAAWGLQGAAMIWLGVRQQRRLALAAGVVLQLAAGAALYQGGPISGDLFVLNGLYLGAALIAFAGGLSSWLADRPSAAKLGSGSGMAGGFLVWATAWWVAAGLAEIERHLQTDFELTVSLLFMSATVLAATLSARRLAWPRLNALGLLALPALVLGLAAAALTQSHPFARHAWLAWPMLFAAHALFLRLREMQFPALQGAWHAVAYWVFAALLLWETNWQVDRLADGAWPSAAALAVVAGFVLVTLRSTERVASPLRATQRVAWPLGAHRRTYVFGACGAIVALLALLMLSRNFSSSGLAEPLPYLPLMNPLELASIFVMIVLVYWWRLAKEASKSDDSGSDDSGFRGFDSRAAVVVPAVLGLILLTMSVARAVHHWADVPFDLELLARSTVLQAALSIVWGTTALGAMLVGARSLRRVVWLAGAALMALVVAKLFIVELGNAGTVGRVVSFLGVGVLLLVVGYFAPVPPRTALAESRA